MSEEKGGGITFGAAVDMGGGDIISGDKMSGNVQKGDGNTMNVSGETGPFDEALESAETDEQRELIGELAAVAKLEASEDNVATADGIISKLVATSTPDLLTLLGSGLRATGSLIGGPAGAVGYVAEAGLKILASKMK